MKNILIITILLTLTTWSARALDWTYSTNLYWGLDYPTNIYMGTNASDGATNGDTFSDWAWKLNAMMNLTQRRWDAQMATNAFFKTNASTGGSGGLTNIVFTNNVNASVVQVFNNGGLAGYTITASNTVTGTNTITAYAFSNMVLSSRSQVTYQTNMAFWNASNFLGRVNGLHKFTASGGDDGANPPVTVPVHFVASYNGSNGWFRITNNIFYTSNTISVALIRDGARPINPGAAKLTTIDHWELKDRTNSTFGQYWEIDYPVSPQNPATKEYVDGLFLNTYDANWSSYTSNNIFHYVFQKYNKVIVDMTSATAFIPIATNSFDGANMLMVIQQTNLTTGYLIESLTDLAFQNSWQTWTNYTLSTNSGAVTFTVPINLSEETRFFRARGQATNTVAFAAPVHFNGGTVWPSNTFNLADITNRLAALGTGKHYWTGSSNGLALITLSYSNGVVRYVRRDE